MYTGSADNDSLHHAIKEGISNSIDEFLAGYGHTIEIDLNTVKNSIKIRDYGRGIPFNKIVDVATVPHSGGKFKKEGSAYGASSGLNGTGMKILTAIGTNTVTSIRAGKACSYTFNHQSTTERKESQTKEKDGTIIEWTPDDNVVKDGTTLYLSKIEKLLEDFSYPTPGLTFVLFQNGKKIKTYHAKSINDFLSENIPSDRVLSPIMPFKAGNSYLMVEGALIWSNSPAVEKSYLNLIPTVEGGTHITVLRTVLTREVNKAIGSDLKGEEIRKGMSFIISVKTLEDPIFAGQQKHKVNMPTLNAPLSKLLTDQISLLIEQHKDFFQKLQETVEKERKKEAAVAQVRNTLAKTKSKTNPIPDKLKPCLGEKGELFITEGISASGSLISQRDVYKSAIMSLKGKPINTRKHDISKVLKNTEIQDLIIALGGFGDDFNIGRMKYDKIFILADADPDGSHIDLLLINFFFQFYPEIIRQGKLYSIKTPLYIITDKKGKREYIFTHEEMEKKRKQIPQTSNVSYAKGLGELEPEILGELAFGKNRKLIQFQAEDEEVLESLLNKFMGEDAAERREYVNS